MSKRFWWFDGASVDALREQLNGPVVRVEFRVDKAQQATITVVRGDVVTTEGGGGPINDSHVCPPQCP